MATSTFCEIQSFLSKFYHLSSLGINANISFGSDKGNVHVNFEADLGSLLPTMQSLSSKQHQKPSKIRRRRRRSKARLHDVQPNPNQQETSRDEN